MLEIRSLNVKIRKKTILNDINIKLVPHTLTAIIGKNGSGKSTLVSCINQRISYTGELFFQGRNICLMTPKERACLISILPQMLKAPHISVNDLVCMGRTPYVDLGHHFTEYDKKAVEEAIHIIGIEKFSSCYVDELSGGERQKAYLAMILAQQTRLMVLDEPTTYMDMAYEQQFMNLLNELKRGHKKTLFVIMHNLNSAIRFADRIAILDKGRLVFDGTKEECLKECMIEKNFGVKRYECEDQIFFTL